MTQRIFVSSVQGEFASERRALRDFVHGDPLLRRFFTVFLFEDVPATDRRVDAVYLDEVDRCDVYVGLLGTEYGTEDAQGVSPTEREFDRATERNRTRLLFLKHAEDRARHPKTLALISKVSSQLVRRRFGSQSELISGLYAALVQVLADADLIRSGPFDAAPCRGATLDDLDPEQMTGFIRRARRVRSFPLAEDAPPEQLLTQLNLLDEGRPTHAAVLLFGRSPQDFLLASAVKCAQFHGTEVAKPIPAYQVYKGTAFELVDQAVDFVMSRINRAVGTRASGSAAPVAYEMPQEVVQEAIVNAVAHRDYSSNGSVQVMLFSDRLEVWNPGALPPSLTVEMLRQPHGSVPANPLLAESLYLAQYIERMGTGTSDMIARCRAAGLPEPRFTVGDGFVVALERRPQSAYDMVGGRAPSEHGTKLALSRHQAQVLQKCIDAQPLTALMGMVGRSDRTKFRNQVLGPLLADGLVAQTIPEKPRSSKQRYRTTERGREVLAALPGAGGHDDDS